MSPCKTQCCLDMSAGWLSSKNEDSRKDPKIRGHSHLTLSVELYGLTFTMTSVQNNKHDDGVGTASEFLIGLARSKVLTREGWDGMMLDVLQLFRAVSEGGTEARRNSTSL